MKIQYLTTEFVTKLMMNNGEDDEQVSVINDTLEQYFNYDLILLPFMQVGDGKEEESRVVLVSVKVLDNQVDLFDKEFRDNDSKSI